MLAEQYACTGRHGGFIFSLTAGHRAGQRLPTSAVRSSKQGACCVQTLKDASTGLIDGVSFLGMPQRISAAPSKDAKDGAGKLLRGMNETRSSTFLAPVNSQSVKSSDRTQWPKRKNKQNKKEPGAAAMGSKPNDLKAPSRKQRNLHGSSFLRPLQEKKNVGHHGKLPVGGKQREKTTGSGAGKRKRYCAPRCSVR